MKRFILLALFAATGFPSCNKCTTCTQQQGEDVRICESDYKTNAEYETALDFYETAGYNCFKSW
jgi:hypothetical protein